MAEEYSAIERRIQTACEAARQQKKPNISMLARQNAVPMHRLRARLQGRSSRSQRNITTKRLTESQERAIIRWIELLDSLYVPPTAGVIEANANALLRQNNPDAEPLGDVIHGRPEHLSPLRNFKSAYLNQHLLIQLNIAIFT